MKEAPAQTLVGMEAEVGGAWLPALAGLPCGRVGGTAPVCTEVEAWLLRSITEGVAVGGAWGMRGGGQGGACGWCWAGLEGMPFSDRNSSRSMYSSWKVSPSYGSVLSHSVGPRKADWGALRSSSSFFSCSCSWTNAGRTTEGRSQ